MIYKEYNKIVYVGNISSYLNIVEFIETLCRYNN